MRPDAGAPGAEPGLDQAEQDLLWRQLLGLACVTMLPASWDKRFVRDMVRRGSAAGLTENQRNQVRRLAYRYRRQMSPALVPDRVQLPPRSHAR